MKPIEEIKKIADEHGWKTTKYQYEIIRIMMAARGLDIIAEECKEICNLQRYARMVLEKDETALNLEEKWHKSGQLFAFENEGKKLIKDKIKFA